MEQPKNRLEAATPCPEALPSGGCTQGFTTTDLELNGTDAEAAIPLERRIRLPLSGNRTECFDALDLYRWFRLNPDGLIPKRECRPSAALRRRIEQVAEAAIPRSERLAQAGFYYPSPAENASSNTSSSSSEVPHDSFAEEYENLFDLDERRSVYAALRQTGCLSIQSRGVEPLSRRFHDLLELDSHYTRRLDFRRATDDEILCLASATRRSIGGNLLTLLGQIASDKASAELVPSRMTVLWLMCVQREVLLGTDVGQEAIVKRVILSALTQTLGRSPYLVLSDAAVNRLTDPLIAPFQRVLTADPDMPPIAAIRMLDSALDILKSKFQEGMRTAPPPRASLSVRRDVSDL